MASYGKPKRWEKLVEKGSDFKKVGIKDKIKEFKKWFKDSINSNDYTKLNYFGFNVSYASVTLSNIHKIFYRFIKDALIGNVKGTTKWRILFDEIFNLFETKRGIIAIDWATPRRVEEIVERNNYIN